MSYKKNLVCISSNKAVNIMHLLISQQVLSMITGAICSHHSTTFSELRTLFTDSSFVISKADISSSSAIKDDDAWPVDALSISSRMQQARDTSPPSSPPSPNSPPSPHSPHISPRNRSSPLTNSPHSPERFARDEFISDSRGLADYLRYVINFYIILL